MTTPCRLRDHLPLPIAEPKAWLGWKIEQAADRLHHLATRLDDSIDEDPAAAAVAAYLDLQALKAPEVITPGARIRRYMTTGRAPAA